MPAPKFPRIGTFYGDKGGVGRSMAHVNVAEKRASWGRYVLMVDTDLEAPVISSFLERNQELEPRFPVKRTLSPYSRKRTGRAGTARAGEELAHPAGPKLVCEELNP